MKITRISCRTGHSPGRTAMNNHAAGPLSVGVRTPPGTTLPTPWQVNNRAPTRLMYVSGRRQFGRDDDPDPDVPARLLRAALAALRAQGFPVPLRLEEPSTPAGAAYGYAHGLMSMAKLRSPLVAS